MSSKNSSKKNISNQKKISTPSKKIVNVGTNIKKAKTNPNPVINKNKLIKKSKKLKKKESKSSNKKKLTKTEYQQILEELDKNPNFVPEDKDL
jgi:hypothetical protein